MFEHRQGVNEYFRTPSTRIVPEVTPSAPDIGGCGGVSLEGTEVESEIPEPEQEAVLPAEKNPEIAQETVTVNKTAEKGKEDPDNSTEKKGDEQEKSARRGRPPKQEKA
ncbi:MAG: hypothetical protein FWG30_09155, partial [Eubacteriaceae bacterium]|nr:hypothetical protein [Eubacteriaceae bacterium]